MGACGKYLCEPCMKKLVNEHDKIWNTPLINMDECNDQVKWHATNK